MAIYSKQLLSGSSVGAPIKVTTTASTGNTIHATGTSSSTIDEIWLYANNTSTSPVLLTVQYGGTTSPDDNIQITVPAQSGLTLIIPGLVLTGTGSAATTVYAYAATANVINITGYVNRVA